MPGAEGQHGRDGRRGQGAGGGGRAGAAAGGAAQCPGEGACDQRADGAEFQPDLQGAVVRVQGQHLYAGVGEPRAAFGIGHAEVAQLRGGGGVAAARDGAAGFEAPTQDRAFGDACGGEVPDHHAMERGDRQAVHRQGGDGGGEQRHRQDGGGEPGTDQARDDPRRDGGRGADGDAEQRGELRGVPRQRHQDAGAAQQQQRARQHGPGQREGEGQQQGHDRGRRFQPEGEGGRRFRQAAHRRADGVAAQCVDGGGGEPDAKPDGDALCQGAPRRVVQVAQRARRSAGEQRHGRDRDTGRQRAPRLRRPGRAGHAP
nr:hypothetical protein [Roseomonas rosulenta]